MRYTPLFMVEQVRRHLTLRRADGAEVTLVGTLTSHATVSRPADFVVTVDGEAAAPPGTVVTEAPPPPTGNRRERLAEASRRRRAR